MRDVFADARLSGLPDELRTAGECLADPELHDGPDPLTTIEHLDARAAREDVAREVCGFCPVAAKCLAFALRTRPVRGVWAGFTAEQIGRLADLAATSPVRPVVVGIDEAVHLFTASSDLDAETARLLTVNVLSAGIPSMGKSGASTRLAMRWAADDRFEVAAVDGKDVA